MIMEGRVEDFRRENANWRGEKGPSKIFESNNIVRYNVHKHRYVGRIS